MSSEMLVGQGTAGNPTSRWLLAVLGALLAGWGSAYLSGQGDHREKADERTTARIEALEKAQIGIDYRLGSLERLTADTNAGVRQLSAKLDEVGRDAKGRR